jgi:hypothetical protein
MEYFQQILSQERVEALQKVVAFFMVAFLQAYL